jgi:hypothetical protein
MSDPSGRTDKARAAFAARFPDDTSRREYFSRLGQRSGEVRRSRITISAQEAAALGDAYAILRRVAGRLERSTTMGEGRAATDGGAA